MRPATNKMGGINVIKHQSNQSLAFFSNAWLLFLLAIADTEGLMVESEVMDVLVFLTSS